MRISNQTYYSFQLGLLYFDMDDIRGTDHKSTEDGREKIELDKGNL